VFSAYDVQYNAIFGPFQGSLWVISQTFKEPRKPLYRPSPASSLSRDSLLWLGRLSGSRTDRASAHRHLL